MAAQPGNAGLTRAVAKLTRCGRGTALRGFSLRSAVGLLRDRAGLAGVETIRREGAPIPMRPLRRWDNGRDVVLAGALWSLRKRTRLRTAGILANLAAGACLLLALRGALVAAEAQWILLALGAALVAHVTDVALRIRGRDT